MSPPVVTRLGGLAYLGAAVVLILDQLSKYWILYVHDLPSKVTTEVGGPLWLTMVWNRGVSFGLLRADQDLTRWGLTIFSLVVAVILIGWVRNTARPLMAAGLSMIIGGAIGNAIDRARFGAVVDFIDVQRLGFFPWVFNVADAGITVGVVFLLLDSLRRDAAP
jgi:signal peptidase II